MPRKPERADASWAALGLVPELVRAVGHARFGPPTDIQRELIPPALAGRDCLGQAKTGTGKTAAFALPMLQRLQPGQPSQAIVLVPTRELAAQVDQHIRNLDINRAFKTALLYGGRPIREQVAQLAADPEIIVGTPGRVLDLNRRGHLKLADVRLVVLDEVDRMLDIGFRDDIRRVLRSIKTPHQTIFVSATIDEEIRRLAKTFMRDPVELDVSADSLTVESIEQGYVSVRPEDKLANLLAFLEHENPTLAIAFTNTKAAAHALARELKQRGVRCKEIHGDLIQSRRERVMKSFRNAQIQVLVATDLASRGLDVMEISHIVNYDVPEDPAVYVHRVGRTARMGQRGYAITFVGPDEGKLLTEVEKLINKEILKLDRPWIVRQPEPQLAPPPPPSRKSNGPVVPSRYLEAMRRCAVLESYGIKPVPRTLGSRFRSPRRR